MRPIAAGRESAGHHRDTAEGGPLALDSEAAPFGIAEVPVNTGEPVVAGGHAFPGKSPCGLLLAKG